jgi:hypothetical protein
MWRRPPPRSHAPAGATPAIERIAPLTGGARGKSLRPVARVRSRLLLPLATTRAFSPPARARAGTCTAAPRNPPGLTSETTSCLETEMRSEPRALPARSRPEAVAITRKREEVAKEMLLSLLVRRRSDPIAHETPASLVNGRAPGSCRRPAQELLASACRIRPASLDVCIEVTTRRGDAVPAAVLSTCPCSSTGSSPGQRQDPRTRSATAASDEIHATRRS